MDAKSSIYLTEITDCNEISAFCLIFFFFFFFFQHAEHLMAFSCLILKIFNKLLLGALGILLSVYFMVGETTIEVIRTRTYFSLHE